MLVWRDLIDRLRDEGVSLETTDLEFLTADGERAKSQFLVRWVGGRPLYHVVEIESLGDPVPKFMVRRLAIALALPADRFVWPADAL